MAGYLWLRFRWLRWPGKLLTISVVLYGFGWVCGNLGAHGMARQFGEAGILVFSVLLTGLVIRGLWRQGTIGHRK